jgi:hypothetical protein
LTIRGPLEGEISKPNFIYREADWKLFQNYLVNNLSTQCRWELLRERDVAVKHLTDTINTACHTAENMNLQTNAKCSINTYPYTKRNKLRTQWQRTRDITLRPLINALKEQIDSTIKEQLSDTWQRTLRGLVTNNMKDTWRITKNLIKSNPNIPPLTINRKTATTTQEKLNLFCGYI